MDKIESRVMAIYKDTQEQLPKLHHLSFEVTTYEHSGETKLSGFIHVDKGCESFDSISELKNIIQKKVEKQRIRKILHRNFKGIL